MNAFKTSQNLLAVFLVLLIAATPLSLNAAEEQSDKNQKQAQDSNEHQGSESGKVYFPSDDAMSDLEITLNKARASNKLALVILGANWCHDSLALASRLQVEPLKTLVNERYETLFVDVGNLSEGRDVIQSLGVPIYYATPTVLIVDPVSANLVNAGNRHMWANADSISMEDSVAYFEQIADTDLNSLANKEDYTPAQARLMNNINRFEQVQADRLAEAYVITGAMLEADFDRAIWKEVGQFRNSVATDVDALRAEVTKRVANGETDIVLAYPEYPEWSWNSRPDENAE